MTGALPRRTLVSMIVPGVNLYPDLLEESWRELERQRERERKIKARRRRR
jgi:hypothetical protein